MSGTVGTIESYKNNFLKIGALSFKFESYKQFIGKVKAGKKLPDSIYIHNSALFDIPEELVNVLEKISTALKIKNSDYTLEKIRHSINRARVLGDERFKQQIEKQTGRRVSPFARGGDRRSEEYRAKS